MVFDLEYPLENTIRVAPEIHQVDNKALKAKLANDRIDRWLALTPRVQLALGAPLQDPFNVLEGDAVVVLDAGLVYLVNSYSIVRRVVS
jgi:hypothetical protein